ncbi:hypothetical protein M0802_006385 [Mischocyttarus mexicanus]|nr:hypothetical protein M0802_006385 [Mischocyttarus mexicanus]
MQCHNPRAIERLTPLLGIAFRCRYFDFRRVALMVHVNLSLSKPLVSRLFLYLNLVHGFTQIVSLRIDRGTQDHESGCGLAKP